MPRVSVVMSVYNGEPYLRDAVSSILTQTYTDFEFIVIDDGSSDKSAEIVQSCTDARVVLVRQDNQGLPAGLNRAIGLSKGEYVARMDADDISEPSRLLSQIRYMDAHPECVLVGTGALVIDADGQPLCRLNMPQESDVMRQILREGSSPFVHGSVLFRKAAALRCGLYDERAYGTEDWVLWTKLIELGELMNLAQVLYRHRLNPAAITTLPRHLAMLKLKTNKKYLATGVLPVEDIIRLRMLQKRISQRERRALYLLGVGKTLTEHDWQPLRARRYLWQSISILPWNLVTWINLAFCFLPQKWVATWKRYRTGRRSERWNMGSGW